MTARRPRSIPTSGRPTRSGTGRASTARHLSASIKHVAVHLDMLVQPVRLERRPLRRVAPRVVSLA